MEDKRFVDWQDATRNKRDEERIQKIEDKDYCRDCDSYVEFEFREGRWYCPKCGTRIGTHDDP